MNKNRNEAAEVVENFYCFFNIIEPGVLYYTFYDEKILFYPHLFYSFTMDTREVEFINFLTDKFWQHHDHCFSLWRTLTNHLYNDLCTVLVVLLHF